MGKNADQIWNIFLGLTDYLKTLDKKENGDKDWNHYKDENPAGYRLITLEPNHSHDSEEAKNSFKVLPLVDGEKTPYWSMPFDKLTAPTKKYNAIAVIGIGHQWDEYDTKKRSDGGDEPRWKAAKEKVFPKFVADMNAFLIKQNVDSKPLKAEIVNGKDTSLNVDLFPYDKYWDYKNHSYYPYIVPLAIRVSFA